MAPRIAVMTSGGDAPSMNGAVRAVVRTSLNHNLLVYGIYEGYQGLVDGGDCIRPMEWADVRGVCPLPLSVFYLTANPPFLLFGAHSNAFSLNYVPQ